MRDKRFSPATIDSVEAAMTTSGETPRVIAARLPHTAISTVRFALAELVKQGRVAFDGPIGHRRYWRMDPQRVVA